MLNPDYRDILSLLNEEKAEYLVVGAFAMAAHGVPRATGDIDIWINPSDTNSGRVWNALSRFGAPLEKLSREDFETAGLVLQIGLAPKRIDILTSIDDVAFSEAWEARESIEIEGMTVFVISKKHLIINKKALGRPQDRVDIDRLSG